MALRAEAGSASSVARDSEGTGPRNCSVCLHTTLGQHPSLPGSWLLSLNGSTRVPWPSPGGCDVLLLLSSGGREHARLTPSKLSFWNTGLVVIGQFLSCGFLPSLAKWWLFCRWVWKSKVGLENSARGGLCRWEALGLWGELSPPWRLLRALPWAGERWLVKGGPQRALCRQGVGGGHGCSHFPSFPPVSPALPLSPPVPSFLPPTVCQTRCQAPGAGRDPDA